MDSYLSFLQNYPLIGGSAIATTSAAIGWIFRNLFEIFIEKKRYEREQRTFFWKEKINASKKASEFYFEYANFLNLIQIQFENYELEKIGHTLLIENFQKEVDFYTNKLKTFPHFEHHHINLFYEFNEEKALDINNKVNALNRQISELNPEIDNSEQVKELFKELKTNYGELADLQKTYTRKVREDLKAYL